MMLDRRLNAFRPDLADARLAGRVETGRFVAGERMQVASASAPMHREPRHDAGLDTEALAGEAVTVFEIHEGWAWVQLESDGYVGYLPADRLGPPGPAPSHRVAVSRTPAYPGPSMKLPHAAMLPLGARLAVTGRRSVERQGEFVCVTGVAGLAEAWVFANHVSPLDEPAGDACAVAEQLLGGPYLWGGRTSLGLDCSALAQLACDAAGIALPRDSDMQEAAALPAVDPAAGLRRGDLVFWKGHVGMMRSPTELIHASGHQMLVVSEPLAQAAARIEARGGGGVTRALRPFG